jgi:hypothetical protein
LAAADAREVMRLFWTPKHARQLNECIDDADSLAQALEKTTFPSGHSTTPTQAGGNSSPSFDMLGWAEREVVQILRNRIAAISITRNDASTFTDRWETV